jgi:uncharacterized protein YcnI
VKRRPLISLIGVLAAFAAGAPVAGAHVQVTPSTVAPEDAVAFEVLVPNEQEQETVEVAVQIPKGVLAFAFEPVPGWKRSTENASDGSVGVVRWKGRMGADEFVRFSFVASTPAKPGDLAFKAVQTYADKTVVRWIGAPDAEEPAPVVRIVAGAPKQNAGGEAGDGGPAGQAATAAPASSSGSDDDKTPDGDGLALGLGAGGLALGLMALIVALRRPARRDDG